MTMAMKIRPGVFPGTQSFVTLNTSTSVFSSLLGTPLAAAIKPGTITVGNFPAVYNVLPGGGTIKAGQPITIVGSGFDAGAKLSLEPAVKFQAQFLNSNTFIVTTATDFQLDGARIRIINTDKAKSTAEYYSYLRAQYPSASSDLLLAQTVPLFAANNYTEAFVPTASPVFGSNLDTGIALENADSSDATVQLEISDAFGVKLAETRLIVPAYNKFSRTVQELFGVKPSVTSAVRVRSLVAIRVMGILINQTTQDVFPINVIGVPVP